MKKWRACLLLWDAELTVYDCAKKMWISCNIARVLPKLQVKTVILRRKEDL